jgi:hypothetical protein
MVLEMEPCVMLILIANITSRTILVRIQQSKKLLTFFQLAQLWVVVWELALANK